MSQSKTYTSIKGLLLTALFFAVISVFSQNSGNEKVIKHNNQQTGADVYVNNVFFQNGDLYLDLVNTAKATTFYINGKMKNNDNNKAENIKYLIVLDSNNLNMLVIPADNIDYIEFYLTNATTRSNDYVYFSLKGTDESQLLNNISSLSQLPVVKAVADHNSSTSLSVNLNKASEMNIDIFDLSGQKVANAANGFYPAGNFEVSLSDKNLANGIYICMVNTNGRTQSFKFLNKR